MFIFLTKFLPLIVYPLGLIFSLLFAAFFVYRRPRWLRLFLILSIFILWMSSNRWTALSLTRSLEWRYLPPNPLPQAEAIVILGGGTDPVEYPRSTVEANGAVDRVLYGAHLYQQGASSHILVTGGRIDWMGTGSSPAEEMSVLLQKLGIPKEAIWLESESRNTYENALYSRRFLKEKKISRIILVTSALHMPRSVGLFESQGFEVIPAPTDFSVTFEDWERLKEASPQVQLLNLFPSADNLSSVTTSLKEYLGMLFYQLQGLT
jgi:uncharacterized SAM-binding protein YcdF (DUF218 family)